VLWSFDFYFLPNIIRVVKSRRIGLAEHVARMGGNRHASWFWLEIVKEEDCLEDQGVDGRPVFINSQCHCPRHISHGLTCDSTRASTMRSRRPVFCYIARLREHNIKKVVERRECIELFWIRRDTSCGLL